jgi:hypothetical protein
LRATVDYFSAGVRQVWYVYPQSRQVMVYFSPTERTTLSEGDELDGGDVLPGFRMKLTKLFLPPAGSQT